QRDKEQQPRHDTNSCCKSANTSSTLRPATSGSLGLDLAAAVTVTLMSSKPEKVPTGIKGPITINGRPVGALLLGRSSISLLGLFVLPGVIDADYSSEIQVMVHTPFPPARIKQGQRIAQLVLLEQLTKKLTPHSQAARGDRGFGSSGEAALLTLNLHERPTYTVQVTYKKEQISLRGLLDAGADSSIISPSSWPNHWPLYATSSTVSGVGGLALAQRSPLVTITIEKQSVQTTVSVVTLPPTVQCLIGRDVLTQLEVML
ncbi:POK9 protein, partial [Ptilorrhoa leucosticta]|nr:POK9 protein [Ptilorrhoa leucosticta]